jgi:hypothetical protein
MNRRELFRSVFAVVAWPLCRRLSAVAPMTPLPAGIIGAFHIDPSDSVVLLESNLEKSRLKIAELSARVVQTNSDGSKNSFWIGGGVISGPRNGRS